jgi:phage FluMu protein Com
MIKKLHCNKCDATWERRKEGELPVQCPRCKSLKWNVPKKKKKG